MRNPLLRRSVVVVASAATLMMLCGSLRLIAQEPKAGSSQTQAKAKRDSARRLPAYFAQIGLSDSQKEEIYKIQGKHVPRIAALEKQIDDLRAQMMRECEGVLKAAQKRSLEEHRTAAAEAKKKRKATAKPEP